ncbi:hypothetical protein HKX48_007705 [Thoreauomyces humboldtii]|nr:hypothetical protein HKX48_007705 [Thoreauomyces humboldtii]
MLKNTTDSHGKRFSQSQGPVRKVTVTGKKLHYLVPDLLTDDDVVRSAAEKFTHDDDKGPYLEELKKLATDLNFVPIIHLMKLKEIETVIESIPVEELVMNLCDGSDVDGVPGPSVAAYLEAKNYANVVGCDSLFINNTLTKNGMKELFREHLVSTPPGFALTKDSNLPKLIEEWGMTYPLFVKISDSYGSVGLDDSSVCHDFAQIEARCAKLLVEFENLTVEEYIEGPEYSVLVSGNCRDENQNVIVYPPAERAFSKNLPRFARFVSYVRNWDPTQNQQHAYEAVPDPNDFAALQDLSRRAYAAVSGNAYGRVDIRKRDVSGKFYVLEVNASCGLGNGTSSDFILRLAGQTTQDFFQILLSSVLKPPVESTASPSGSFGNLTAEPVAEPGEEADKVWPMSPLSVAVEEKVAKMIRNPSLALVPNPVVHVVCAAVLIDPEACIPDPEGKLTFSYGKDVEYVSELESIFRSLYYDPIVHVYNVDDVADTLKKLSKDDDLIFNACLGKDGLEVAKLIEEIGFAHTVGLNARFFAESHDRQLMRDGLSKNRLSVPTAIVVRKTHTADNLSGDLSKQGIAFPVYIKPARRENTRSDASRGQKVATHAELAAAVASLPEGMDWLVEDFVEGAQYMVLIAGDARDPCADLIVFPPVKLQVSPAMGSRNSSGNGIASLVRKLSILSMGKNSNAKSSSTATPAGGRGNSTLDDNGEAASNPPVPTQVAYTSLKHPEDLLLQMDLQDLARRAFVAVHGSCYGLVTIIDHADGTGLTVVGVQGDVRFGDQKSGKIIRSAGLDAEALFSWLLKRPVKA